MSCPSDHLSGEAAGRADSDLRPDPATSPTDRTLPLLQYAMTELFETVMADA
jgi:hypothetical protein